MPTKSHGQLVEEGLELAARIVEDHDAALEELLAELLAEVPVKSVHQTRVSPFFPAANGRNRPRLRCSAGVT